LFLIGSASQDASLIALSGLYLALFLRVLTSSSPRPVGDLISAACVAMLLAFGRPPYFALMLPLVVAYGIRRGATAWQETILFSAIVTLIFFAYWIPFALTGTPQIRPGTDYSAQLVALRTEPMLFVSALGATIRSSVLYWYESGLGILGSQNALLPRAAYVAYGLAVPLSVAATCLSFRAASMRIASLSVRQTLAVSLSCMIGFGSFLILIAAVFYLMWTLPNAGIIDGILGRYFIPAGVVCFNGMFAPFLTDKAHPSARSLVGLCNLILVCGILVSCALVIFTVRNRFYI